MRVLVVALALASGCYSPSIGDCQFRCTGSGDCPDGAECRNGACRTSSGGCAAGNDANNPCPGAPQAPSNCGNKFALDSGGCGVLCTGQRQHDEIAAACGTNWRAGILDNVAELDLVPSGSDPRYWVGAGRASTTSPFLWSNGVQVAVEAWDAGFPALAGSDCVHLESARKRLRNDRSCSDDLEYICTFP